MRYVLAVLTLLLATMGPALAARVTLSGEVTYRERIALPPGGVLTVALIDLAAPAQPRVSARAVLEGPGQVPLIFTLDFEDSVILPGHEYGILAEISDGRGTAWFRNADPFPVDPLAPAEKPVVIVNIVPQVEQPVEEATVVPEPATVPILNTTWTAQAIDGKPVARDVTSSLSIASDMRAGGRGGCNSWFAQAELDAERLVFSAVAATKMACLSETATAQEDSFFAALSATRFWRLDGQQLNLLDADGAVVATLASSI